MEEQTKTEAKVDYTDAHHMRHWSRTRNVTIVMLVIWFIFAFVVHWFAKPLNEFSFLGFPLGFYMAVQGSLLVFVIQIFVHNKIQDKIDDDEGFTSKAEDGDA